VELLERLDDARRRWDVLNHPFYRRWNRGELLRDELARYSGEYRHAVTALADQSAACARQADPARRVELAAHAAEEAAHVEMWDDFARAVGGETDRAPLPESAECAEAWTAGDGMLERLAVLYALEASQPAIAQTKLDGLVEHYGMTHEDAGVAYFRLHAERDHDHAAHSRAILAATAREADADRLVELAEAALAGNWKLLDGMETPGGL